MAYHRPRSFNRPHPDAKAQFRAVAEAIRIRVPMRQAAAHYGLSASASGFCRCPFHAEDTPSFKIYPDDRGWFCFGCNAGGDVLAFAEKWYSCGPMEAAKRVDADFSLGLFDNTAPPPTSENNAYQSRKAAEDAAAQARDALYAELREIYHTPPGPALAAKLGRAEYIEYCLTGY